MNPLKYTNFGSTHKSYKLYYRMRMRKPNFSFNSKPIFIMNRRAQPWHSPGPNTIAFIDTSYIPPENQSFFLHGPRNISNATHSFNRSANAFNPLTLLNRRRTKKRNSLFCLPHSKPDDSVKRTFYNAHTHPDARAHTRIEKAHKSIQNLLIF